MIIRFSEPFSLPAADIYAFFESPPAWVQLFGFAGAVNDRGDGWYAVPLKNFPFPLVAKVTIAEPFTRVRWTFRGFWRGTGEVRLVERPDDVLVEGYEEIAVRWLGVFSPLIERMLLDRQFRRLWNGGWRRLRKREATVER